MIATKFADIVNVDKTFLIFAIKTCNQTWLFGFIILDKLSRVKISMIFDFNMEKTTIKLFVESLYTFCGNVRIL